jgi:hypothetical protein
VRLPGVLLVLLLAGALLCAQGRAQTRADDANLVLLEVRLDSLLLSDAVTGYEIGRDVFLPLGEMARLLTIAIRTDPAHGRAEGSILREERGFSLDVDAREVRFGPTGGVREAVDPRLVRVLPDDIYVASRLLAHWLPVDVDIDLGSLLLKVRPREQLPLQARLARQQLAPGAAGRPGVYTDPGYPRVPTPYRLASVPFLDQTFALATGANGGRRALDAAYTGYLTADLLGLEAALYASHGRDTPGRMRLTLGRNDPDGGLLGPLHARTLLAGGVALPGVANLSAASATGNGVVLSNRPLDRPVSFDRTSLTGNLAPGWDVELYHNGALVGFQQSRTDGRYAFEDQPLLYGPNDFRLVFHGPLGQVRIERRGVLLEASAVPSGAAWYDLAVQRDDAGRARALAQLEWGVGEHLNATAGWQRVPVPDGERRYARAGVRGYWNAFIVTADVARADDGGRLAQLGLATRLGNVAVSASRAVLDGFSSELLQPRIDPVRVRDALRAEGTVDAGGILFPLALDVRRDLLASNGANLDVQGRVAAYRDGTAVSNALRWQILDGRRAADGVLQLSRRVAGTGLTGQLQYRIAPRSGLGSVTVSADRLLADGWLLNLGMARAFEPREVRVGAALNRSLGRYGIGMNAFWTNRHTYGAGLQFFMALGREPRGARLLAEAQPMAAMGAAAVRVFLDKNGNGVFDGGDEPIRGAGFTLNGASQLVRTDAAGLAYLARLPAHQHADLALDTTTLDDPQWQALTKGVRIVPRPGAVTELDFAVGTTGEVDGTAWLGAGNQRRPAAGLRLELVDAAGKVAASGASAADGNNVITGIFPGTYRLRVAPDQLARFGLLEPGGQPIVIGRDGTIVGGRDVTLRTGETSGP